MKMETTKLVYKENSVIDVLCYLQALLVKTLTTFKSNAWSVNMMVMNGMMKMEMDYIILIINLIMIILLVIVQNIVLKYGLIGMVKNVLVQMILHTTILVIVVLMTLNLMTMDFVVANTNMNKHML